MEKNKEKKPENPSAFPELDWYQTDNRDEIVYKTYGGMSLRDYFAAKAMQSMVDQVGLSDGYITKLIKEAYKIADEMLKQRES